MNLNACLSFALLSISYQRMAKLRIIFLEEDESKESEMIYLAENISEKLKDTRARFENLSIAEQFPLDYTKLAQNSIYCYVDLC
jgi:hypothetical protein